MKLTQIFSKKHNVQYPTAWSVYEEKHDYYIYCFFRIPQNSQGRVADTGEYPFYGTMEEAVKFAWRKVKQVTKPYIKTEGGLDTVLDSIALSVTMIQDNKASAPYKWSPTRSEIAKHLKYINDVNLSWKEIIHIIKQKLWACTGFDRASRKQDSQE